MLEINGVKCGDRTCTGIGVASDHGLSKAGGWTRQAKVGAVKRPRSWFSFPLMAFKYLLN